MLSDDQQKTIEFAVFLTSELRRALGMNAVSVKVTMKIADMEVATEVKLDPRMNSL